MLWGEISTMDSDQPEQRISNVYLADFTVRLRSVLHVGSI